MSALEKKLARDVAKLRKVLEVLRHCNTDGSCAPCPFAPRDYRCNEKRVAMMDTVLAATAKKPRG